MKFSKKSSILFIILCSLFQVAYADERIISGTIRCSAEWNELCEDKKILSVPEHFRLCQHKILVTEKIGDGSYQVVSSDQTSVTVYFRAKGNQDRFKPQGASIKLNIDLLGVKTTESCEETTAKPEPVFEPLTLEPLATPPETAIAAPDLAPTLKDKDSTLHACACSQFLNWIKVENCLSREKRDDRPPCDSYEVTIQCVASRDQCRTLQRDNCPQVAGLNQSTSFKRLYIENSPYCRP